MNQAAVRVRLARPIEIPRPTVRHNLVDNWRLFGLAAAIEAKELAECESARMRLVLERVRRINPVMMRNVESTM